MASFDPEEQRMCVRVVYDGAASAGKTTNLRQLGQLFASQRATEVTTPAELRGRTLYFDWIQIAAGVVCGFPLICQVISVPGQVAFNERRRHLLRSADVVVYVCDSTQTGAARAREAITLVETIGRETSTTPPILIQANKQDQVDALGGKALLERIGRPDLSHVEAIATEGIGVVDTFVAAVRTIARTLQARTEREGLRLPVRPIEGMKHVLAQVASAPIDPHGAAELLLEEASAAYVFGLDDVTLRAPQQPAARLRAALADRGAPSAPPANGPASSRDVTPAPLPNADVPTGFIWPAHTGRVTLRKLARDGALDARVDVGADVVELAIDEHVLSTSLEHRFGDAETARQALVRAARERTQLGPLLVHDTVVVVQPSSDGSSWLWMVTPTIDPITTWLAEGDSHVRLEAFAVAVAIAASVSARHDIAFVAVASAFGVQQGNVRYRGPLLAGASEARSVSTFLHALASEIAALGHDVEWFVGSVESELARRLTEAELSVVTQEPLSDARRGSEVARELLHDAFERLAGRRREPAVRPPSTKRARSPEGTRGPEVS